MKIELHDQRPYYQKHGAQELKLVCADIPRLERNQYYTMNATGYTHILISDLWDANSNLKLALQYCEDFGLRAILEKGYLSNKKKSGKLLEYLYTVGDISLNQLTDKINVLLRQQKKTEDIDWDYAFSLVPEEGRLITKEEILFLYNIGLCLGAKTFLSHGYAANTSDMSSFSPVSFVGSRLKSWWYLSAVQRQLKAWQHIYTAFDWQGYMAVPVGNIAQDANIMPFDDFRLKRHKRIINITNSEETLIGCFEDKEGYDGFCIMNFAAPQLNLVNNISINFAGADSAILISEGIKKNVSLIGGKLELSLKSGEAVFVIPYGR